MNNTPRRGLNTPVVTVLDEAGRVIEEQQRRVVRHIVQDGRGAEVVFGVGTTGEWNRLDNRERQRAMQIEIDEVRRINREHAPPARIEIWVGVNGSTRAEILANLDAALQLGADAAVIAPLAVEDLPESELVRFFQREITELLESARRELPVFLYDNADIAAPGRAPHIRTRIVKHLSRLPWVRGIKVSASRRVIGNYARAALHYKLPGEFGIYIGNAMLIFDMYRPSQSLLGRLREGWRDYLLHATPPIGVVSGPANVMPREWRKAWSVCWAGDEPARIVYESLCGRFEEICRFTEHGRPVVKMIAALKYALELDGVLGSSAVAAGTPTLSGEQKREFAENYRALREEMRNRIAPRWQTTCPPQGAATPLISQNGLRRADSRSEIRNLKSEIES
jgi:dihydrodipicolinate synthase/N-acetylneuraminate lyase